VRAAEIFPGDGKSLLTTGSKVSDESTEAFLTGYLAEFRDYIIRVLTVLPR